MTVTSLQPLHACLTLRPRGEANHTASDWCRWAADLTLFGRWAAVLWDRTDIHRILDDNHQVPWRKMWQQLALTVTVIMVGMPGDQELGLVHAIYGTVTDRVTDTWFQWFQWWGPLQFQWFQWFQQREGGWRPLQFQGQD